MKGDFSRLPQRGRHYSGVWMQQGRVQLDQDWNDQLLADAERARAALRDLVGEAGAPASDPGFRVRARGGAHCGGDVLLEMDADVDLVFPGGEITVEVRVLVEENDGGGVVVEIEGLLVLWIDAAGRPAFRLGTGEGAALASPEPLPRGVPVLVSAAYDGRVAVLHLDGRPVAAAPLRPLQRPGDRARLRLGGSGGARGAVQNGFGGTLDEVRLWSHARTPQQVRDHAGRSLHGREPGLAAYFPLDEGEGGHARDAVSGRSARARGGDVRWRPHALTVGSGRFYVDGLGVSSPAETPFDAQPDLPGATPPGPGWHLVYLDVWERYLSAAEDPSIREVALGGLDTTGRTRTVWQVKSVALRDRVEWRDALRRLERGRRPAMSAQRVPAGSPATGNQLYRVEVHDPGGPYGFPRPAGEAERAARVDAVQPDSQGGGTLRLRADRAHWGDFPVGQLVELFTRATDQAKQPGTLARVTAVDPAKLTVTLDQLPGGVAAADHPRLRPVASFLWATDNASLVYAVRELDRAAGVAVLDNVGPQGLRLNPGDLVELADDAGVLRAAPGVLRTVREADPYSETITLDAPLDESTLKAGGRIVLRRWSHAATADTPASAVPLRSDQWTPLADGVEVRFEGAAFRTADYWTIPVRIAAPNGIEWPTAGKRPAPMPPQGIEHRYAALAVIDVEHRHDHHHRHHHHHHHGRHVRVHDLRRLFEPLTALTRDDDWAPGHDHHHHEEPPEVHVTVDDHGGDIDVRVEERDGAVEVIAEETDGGTSVDVIVDAHRHHGEEEIRVEVTPEAGGGEEIEVVVDLHDHHHHHHHGEEDEDEEVRVVVHTAPAVPPGCWIFGETPAPPEGYAWTGARLTLPHEERAWTPRAPLPSPRPGRVQCVALDGAVYAFADGTREVLRYDPVFDTWEVETALPHGWRGFAACALGGALHLVGGLDGSGDVVDWHQCYEPAEGRWRARAPLRTPRYDLGAAALGGVLYAAGGMRRRLFTFSSSILESYDPGTDTWTRLHSMKHARTRPGVAAARGRVFVIGGGDPGVFGTDPSEKAESYDPYKDRWKELDDVPNPRLDAGFAELDGLLYLVGGDAGDGPTGLTEVFVPGGGWMYGAPLGVPRASLGLAGLAGRLVSVGGTSATSVVPTVEECRFFTDLYGYRKE